MAILGEGMVECDSAAQARAALHGHAALHD